MHLVIDALAVRPGSAAITVEHMLRGWSQLGTEDRFTFLVDGELTFAVPAGAEVVQVRPPVGGRAGQVWLRTMAVRREAERLGADAVLSGVPASALAGTGCPHGFILYDFRHELRPHQFERSTRLARTVSWGRAMRMTDHIFCISNRTLTDLARLHPAAAHKGILARYGSDHVQAWQAPEVGGTPYALAFGHFANKNVDAVLEGWAELCATETTMTLRLVGLGRADRASATDLVARLGIADRVELMPWLDDDQFEACFAGASLIVFPSDFEGFGLPAIEALRLGIPLVVSTDEALAEVTCGHAEVSPTTRPADLAAAMSRAIAHTPEQTQAGREHAEGFRWRDAAATMRQALASAH